MEDVIVWEAPVPCPDAASVRTRLQRLVGARGGGRAFGVRAHIVREGESFSLQVSVTVAGETGRRTLTETSCEVLTDAAVSIVALAAQTDPAPPLPLVVTSPGAALGPPAPRDASSQRLESRLAIMRPAWRPEPSPSASLAFAGETPVYLGLGGWGAIEAGLLPTPASLVGISASVRSGPWTVLARGGASGDRDIRAEGQIGARASFALGSLGLCRAVFAGPFAPCAGVSLVRLQASGFGEAIVGRTGHAYVPRAELGAVATIGRDHLGVRAGAFATVPLTRSPFVIGSNEEVFRPGAGGRAEVAGFLVF